MNEKEVKRRERERTIDIDKNKRNWKKEIN